MEGLGYNLAISLSNLQILDGETIREWMEPAYKYFDRTGFGHPWELLILNNYTLRTKSGEINGYASQFQMAVSYKLYTLHLILVLISILSPSFPSIA